MAQKINKKNAEQLPGKQGLKRHSAHVVDCFNKIAEQLPGKQGLKPGLM